MSKYLIVHICLLPAWSYVLFTFTEWWTLRRQMAEDYKKAEQS